ncbi:MAG: protein translocase SecG subunit [Planctomycetota bacterium]|jgi:protein translocase SecG subunit
MTTLFYIVFTVLSILLSGIILLQEGQGGGMGAAFGGVGGEAFGHGSGGINKFTAVLATLLLVVAILIATLAKPEAFYLG